MIAEQGLLLRLWFFFRDAQIKRRLNICPIFLNLTGASNFFPSENFPRGKT
jgi:hypothetical protein